MATYVNNLRLKEITTGDEDGTWGTSTNTNLELITDGFSFGTKEMAADANETFTMPDATADATRSLYLKITSAVSLTATREVTLGPNTVSKTWIIENATSGSQIITIKQGSGATVNVANGSKVIIVTDGAGAGAAVLNANPTEIGGTVTSIDVSGGTTGLTTSGGPVTTSGTITLAGTLAVANGGTGVTSSTGTGSVVLSTNPTFAGLTTTADMNFGDNDKAIFGAGNDLQIYHDGSGSYVDDQGTGPLYLRANRIDAVNLSDAAMFTAIGGNAVQLYYNGNEKLATTATGIDVTGTATMDGLTVDGAAAFASNNILVSIQDTNAGGSGGIQFKQSTGAEVGRISFNDGEDLRFFTGSAVTERLNIDGGTGDISFYEDTGTTAKLFWDASAESLGIGTASPQGELHIKADTPSLYIQSDDGQSCDIIFGDVSDQSRGRIRYDSSDNMIFQTNNLSEKMRIDSSGIDVTGGVSIDDDNNYSFGDGTTYIQGSGAADRLKFITNASEAMRIDASGNVGIGNADPQYQLDLNTTGSNTLFGSGISASGSPLNLNLSSWGQSGGRSGIITFTTGDTTNGSERVRIDASGNLLVGKTTASGSTQGAELRADGRLLAVSTSDFAGYFNRKTTDGEILRFVRDTTTVGSIGSLFNLYLYIGSEGGVDTFLSFHNGAIRPATNTGVDNDNALDIGSTGGRWKDFYLAGTANVANVKETVYALTGTALDAGNGGIQTKTLAANTTFTDSLASGESIVLQLEAGASYTVTWPTMQWVTSGGNVAPTLTAKDTLVFWKVSSTLYGAYTGSYV
jgi:hypothetical protein